jgi:hypothetical protein
VAGDAEVGGEGGRGVGVPADDGDHLDLVDAGERGRVLPGDGALPHQDDLRAVRHAPPLRWRVVHNTVDDLGRHP